MKNYDPNTAAKVWDRVRSTAVPPGDSQLILNLITEELQDSRTYQHLAKRLPPPYAAIIRQLSQQSQSQAACLKGIYTMITGRGAIVPPPSVTDDSADIVLRRCYGRTMRALTQYESRQEDPQYGHIFRNLARQEQEHCHRILEILGALAK